ncbi:MAG: VWA-like domain-containing protein, partial [Bacteroidales bacterium]|nr:VWA-like domain-containing protein [Bacteroidales bacterium]
MEEKIKQMLTNLQTNRLDFNLIFSENKAKINKLGSIKLGDYDDKTYTIRIFVTRHNSPNQILNTAIHEYTHHIMNERTIFKEQKRVVHGKIFWNCFNSLLEKAKSQGVFNFSECVENYRIKTIMERWYIREPLLLMACLSHELKPTLQAGAMRSGDGRIEYNPQYCNFLSDRQLEEFLKAEIVRILLLHPYRLPDGYNRQNAYIASNIVLNEYCDFKNLMFHAIDYWVNTKEYRQQYFEFYYSELQKLPTQISPDSEENQNNGNAEDEPTINPFEIAENATALWSEDDYMEQKIKDIIEWATSSNSWGTLSGELQQTLIANLKPEIDYRKVLSSFRSSVLSSRQTLTRFRPSRRYGFEYMGKKPKFTTKLLIGVDVSGSISDNDLQKFYSAINRFFKYGIETLEVQQFDCELKGKPAPIKKAKKEIKILGRGGTCFQAIIDYFADNKKQYDGLIIFTDGYAQIPTVQQIIARKILWVCPSKKNFEQHRKWM